MHTKKRSTAESRLNRFLGLRRFGRLFRRSPILASVARDHRGAVPQDSLNRRLIEQALAPPDDLLGQLETSVRGLAESQAEARLLAHGPNEVEHDRPARWWWHLWLRA